MAILLREQNIISLRTARVVDDGNLVYFTLLPADLESLAPRGGTRWSPKDFDWVKEDSIWLYRHKRSATDESELEHGFPCLDQDLKPMEFKQAPEFKLSWTGSGHSVALYLDGDPWAFIHEGTHQGFSKGILRPASSLSSRFKNPWNQDLFEKTFLEKE